MPDCINLREMFGANFRATYEESYYADHGDGARADDPWLQQIPCDHGTITPYGGEDLAACTNRRGPIARKLLALPCVTPWQDGDDGVNARFHVADFAAVAAVMKPKRKRKLSPEHLAKLTAASTAFRFQPVRHGSNAPQNDRQSDLTTQDDSEAIQTIGTRNRASGGARVPDEPATPATSSVRTAKGLAQGPLRRKPA